MAKKLKIWNGRGYGCRDYSKPHGRAHYEYPDSSEQLFICARSRAEAARILSRAGGGSTGQANSEIKVYFSEGCWGNNMSHIEPEVGIWGKFGNMSDGWEYKCIWKESDDETSD